MTSIPFTKKILVYIPCYNCGDKISLVLSEIPEIFHPLIDCLIIDNCSSDNTSSIISNIIQNNTYPFKIFHLRTSLNLGYAGSQKLAYKLFCASSVLENIIMLHGDGQYPSIHINNFLNYLEKDCGLVNGFRSKRDFPQQEETPALTYLIIKLLSLIESLLLNIPQKEWHSGLVMYSKEYLKKVSLNQLSETMHIDGELIICANILKEKTASFPIYKRYKEHAGLGGMTRLMHIVNVFKIIFKTWRGYYRNILRTQTVDHTITETYKIY